VTRGLIVFSWHNIESTPGFPTTHGRGVDGFERQLRFLARFATVLPLEPALDALYAGEPLPKRAVCLTFDDGYRDNLDLAVPLLRRYGFPATFFLVPAFLDQARGAWWESLGWALGHSRRGAVEFEGTEYRLGPAAAASADRMAQVLKGRNQIERDAAIRQLVDLVEPEGADPGPGLFLDWDGARALAAAGFSIGSHSLDHAILSREDPAVQIANIDTARRALIDGVGQEIATIAYPNGRFADADHHTMAAARAAGHRYGLLLEPGRTTARTDPFAVRRPFVLPHRGAPGLYVQLGRRAVESIRSVPSHLRRPGGVDVRPAEAESMR
jgi:peptidoglycan/xylan/chitin deacetylase (PgdA/CDA1 family)